MATRRLVEIWCIVALSTCLAVLAVNEEIAVPEGPKEYLKELKSVPGIGSVAAFVGLIHVFF